MSEQRVEEILQRPSTRLDVDVKELVAAFLIVALLADNFGKQDSHPPVPTPSKPCVMTLTETICPK